MQQKKKVKRNLLKNGTKRNQKDDIKGIEKGALKNTIMRAKKTQKTSEAITVS